MTLQGAGHCLDCEDLLLRVNLVDVGRRLDVILDWLFAPLKSPCLGICHEQEVSWCPDTQLEAYVLVNGCPDDLGIFVQLCRLLHHGDGRVFLGLGL